MSREILLLVDALAREKNVAKDIVFAALESALASATKKRIHDDADVSVVIDRETGDYTSCRRWIVMPDEEVTNDEAEMGIIDARDIRADVQLGEYIEEGNLEKIVETDTAFHDILYQASRNERLVSIINNLREQITTLRGRSMHYPGRLANTLAEHRIIVDSLAQRDSEKAQKAVREHMENAEQTLLKAIEEEREV